MKVVNYQRVSTRNQDLHRQTTLCKDYCEKNGHEVVMTISEQISGKEQDKESISKLLSLTSDDADLCVVSELSRITREEDYDNIIYYIKTLKRNGLDVVFLDEPENIYKHDEPFTLIQLITLIVRAEGAANELNKIKTRMQSGLIDKLQDNPYMVCGQVPFGFESYANPDYVLGKTPKTLMRFNQREASAIRIAYDMILQGKSCGDVADYFNANGLLHHTKTKGKYWINSEVNKLLKKRLYIGERVVKGVTHKIEPLVSVEVWQAAIDKMSHHRCVITKSETRFNPLKGLFFCAHCGAALTITLSKKGEMQYMCMYPLKKYGVKNKEIVKCGNQSIINFDRVMSVMDIATNDFIKTDEYYGKSKITISQLKEEITALNRKMSDYIFERKEVKKEMTKIEKQIEVMEDEYILKLLDEKYSEVRAKKEEAENNIRELQKQVNKLEMRIGEISSTLPSEDKELTLQEKSDLYNKIIERVEWCGEKRKKTGYLIIKFKNGAGMKFPTTTK